MSQQKESILKTFFEKKSQIKSYMLMMISSFVWVTGYVYGNQHGFSPVQTNLSRSIVMAVGSYVMCKLMNLNIQFRSQKSWRTLLKRHFGFIIQGFIMAWVQFILPLGILHTLASAGPIITLILQRFFFKTQNSQISSRKLQGCIIAIIGMVLTSNGKFLYAFLDDDFEFYSTFENYSSSSYAAMATAALILIISLFFWGYGVLITQQSGCHAFEIVFHFSIMNLLFSSFAYIFLPQKRPAQQMYYSLIWIGLFLFISEVLFNLALNLAQNIALTSVTCFMVVIVGYGTSIIRYHQNVDLISLTGTVCVIIGVSIVILSKNKQSQQNNGSDQQKQLNQVLNNQKTIK